MHLLHIHCNPSRQLALILGLAHLACAGLLGLMELPPGIRITTLILLLISLIYYTRKDALLTASTAVTDFTLSGTMQCNLKLRSGRSVDCTVLGNTFVAPYMIVLNLKPARESLVRSVVLLPDSLDTEEFRQLRVWLRWKWKNKRE